MSYKLGLFHKGKEIAFSKIVYSDNKDTILNGIFMGLFRLFIGKDTIESNSDIFTGDSKVMIEFINTLISHEDIEFKIEFMFVRDDYHSWEQEYGVLMKYLESKYPKLI